MTAKETVYVPWKRYTIAVAEAVIIFTLASFLLGLFLIHHNSSDILTTVLFGVFYAFTVVYTIYRMVQKFSLAALMLMVPIAPLVILIIVVSLIQILQFFK